MREPVVGSVLPTNTNRAFSGGSASRLRITYTNWPMVCEGSGGDAGGVAHDGDMKGARLTHQIGRHQEFGLVDDCNVALGRALDDDRYAPWELLSDAPRLRDALLCNGAGMCERQRGTL